MACSEIILLRLEKILIHSEFTFILPVKVTIIIINNLYDLELAT